MDFEVVATGLRFTESIRWHDGALWVSDWLAGEVLRFDSRDPSAGREVVTRFTGFPFSLEWLPDGRLVVCGPGGIVTGPEQTPYATPGEHWNEIVVGPRGEVYVDRPGAPPGAPPAPGDLWVVEPDGGSRRLADDLAFPNGMAVTPDGATLIVAESHGHRLTAYDLGPDGEVGPGRTWADLGPDAAPDGICLDAEGAVWYADVPNRHCRRVAEGGEVLATLSADQGCFACMLGGEDGRTLYVAGNDYGPAGVSNGRILRARVDVPHAGRP